MDLIPDGGKYHEFIVSSFHYTSWSVVKIPACIARMQGTQLANYTYLAFPI